MTLQEIKKYFFTYRDGLTADVLKKGGIPHKMVFGLQHPQLSALAAELKELDTDRRQSMAEMLWNDRDVRESRLLACWLFEPENIDEGYALRLANDVRSQEEADILAFRLLRHLPYSKHLIDSLSEESPVLKALSRFI